MLSVATWDVVSMRSITRNPMRARHLLPRRHLRGLVSMRSITRNPMRAGRPSRDAQAAGGGLNALHNAQPDAGSAWQIGLLRKNGLSQCAP